MAAAQESITEKVSYSVRAYQDSDFAEVMRIERICFEFPWSESEARSVFAHRFTRVRTIQGDDGRILAYAVYQEHKDLLHLLSLATAPDVRRKGCARLLIDHMLKLLAGPGSPKKIECEVRETNLDAQLFLKSCGFRAMGIEQNFYQNVQEDAYLFVRWHQEDHLVRR